MTTANVVRGEIAVRLGRKDYTLRPTHSALVAIEEKSGSSLLDLARQSGAGGLSLAVAAIVVTECIRAQGRALNDEMMAGFAAERIGEMIQAAGLVTLIGPLRRLLYLAVTGGIDVSGEIVATPKTVETIPGVARRGSHRPR